MSTDELVLQTRSMLRRIQATGGLDSTGFRLLIQVEKMAAAAEGASDE